MAKQKVFISSVQNEFQEERLMLFHYFKEDPLLNMFFEPFIFEEVPATNHSPGQVYLAEVAQSNIYIGLLGCKYGYQDEDGVSPTEHEYDQAKAKNVQRWIYINPCKDIHDKEQAFIYKVQEDVSRKLFKDIDSLKQAVYNSAILFLKQQGFIDTQDFDNSINKEVSLNDIDEDLVKAFVQDAKLKRNFPLKETDSVKKVLTALKLIKNDQLVNSALLVFNTQPQRFFPSATIKCAHFHGTSIQKPIPDYKDFRGTVFNMAEEAVDFVLSKISVSTGTRLESNRVETIYEIPRRVIAEAIINAVAHRNYLSKGSIQVSVFQDRIEVSNPGSLPPELELSDLKKPHNSYPHNPLLADCLFLTGDIERYGTGFLEIYQLTKERDLKEPGVVLNEGFKVIIWRPSALNEHVSAHVTGQVSAHDTAHDTAHDIKFVNIEVLPHRLVWILQGEMSRKEIMDILELKHRTNFKNNYLDVAIEEGWVEMTLPDKLKSKKQKYRLTEKGVQLKNELENN